MNNLTRYFTEGSLSVHLGVSMEINDNATSSHFF